LAVGFAIGIIYFYPMRNLKLIFLLAVSVLPFDRLLFGQSQNLQSISSASGSYLSSNLQVAWNIGEVFADDFSNSKVKIGHGLAELSSIYVITAIDDASTNLYNLYPNPFSTDLTLDLLETSNVTVTLYDLQGRIIEPVLTKDQNKIIISPGPIGAGVYMLSVQDIGKIHLFKIIKK
jgi:hypothetical protein